MDHIRPVDVLIYTKDGADFVEGKSGGISTFESPNPRLKGIWWRLPTGAYYDDGTLFPSEDGNGHWEWQPSQDMPVSDYKAALAALNGQFRLMP